MRVAAHHRSSLLTPIALSALLFVAAAAFGQASYTAQVRGTVKDAEWRDDRRCDASRSLTMRPASWARRTATTAVCTSLPACVRRCTRLQARRAGFRASEQKNVVLQVDQQTTIDFDLHPLGVITTVEVTDCGAAARHGERRDWNRCEQRIRARHPAVRPQHVWAGVSGGRSHGNESVRGLTTIIRPAPTSSPTASVTPLPK